MILSTLINLSMNDQNNILIRQYGVDIVGKKLLVPENVSTFCSNEQDERDTRLKVELLSLVLLRFLYSVEKNRKAFRIVFPPEIFGPFIDIGNYEKNWDKYD